MKITGAAVFDEHDGGGAGGAVSADVSGVGAGQGNPPGGDAIDNIDVPPIAPPSGGQEVDGAVEGAAPSGENTDGAKVTPTPPATYYGGRFTSLEEYDRAHDASGQEGRRLHQLSLENEKTMRGDSDTIEQLRAKLARAQKSDGFRKLDDEELAVLRKDKPSEYVDYVRAMDKREADETAATENLATEQKAAEKEEIRVSDALDNQVRTLRSDTVNYPGYRNLQPVMNQWLKIVPELVGVETAPKLLYYASIGLQKVKGDAAAKKESQESRTEAEKVADANLKLGGTGGTQVPPAGSGGADDEFNASLVKAGPKSVLPG